MYGALLITGVGIGLWINDYRVSRKYKDQLQKFKEMRSEALTITTTSDDTVWFTAPSERATFQVLLERIQREIESKEAYFTSGIPLLRSLNFNYISCLPQFMWIIAFDCNGDFHESYLNFYTRHFPDTIGGVVYREALNKQ